MIVVGEGKNRMFTVKTTVKKLITVALSEEDVTDLMVTAIEGGISYWSCLDNTGEEFKNAPKDESVSETCARILLNGGSIKLIDEEDDNAEYELTLEKLMDGIKLYVANGYDTYDVFGGKEPDMWMCDAECADAIVQLAVFGELVYG